MKEIASALVKAQKAFGPALKTSLNPHFHKKYAALDACIEAVIDALNDNGIMLMQKTHLCDDGVIVETTFIHESGETMSGGVLHVPAAKHDPQGYGGALTYAKRYSLQSACGIAPEDDDGHHATAVYQQKAAAPKAAPKPPAAPAKAVPPAQIAGKETAWHLKISAEPGASVKDWCDLVIDSTKIQAEQATSNDDVMNIFRSNRNIYEKMKELAPESYETLIAVFSKEKAKFQEAT